MFLIRSEKQKKLTFVGLFGWVASMAQDIRHEGVVDSVDGQTVIVRITQSSACGGCQARKICNAAESKDKLVEVEYAGAESLFPGQTVTVAAQERMGMTAVMLAFGLPVLLLILALVAATVLTGSEKIGAFSSLAVLVPYYLVLFLCRERIKKDLGFRIIV